MKQNYINPTINIRKVQNTDVIVTSDVPMGEDLPTGSTDAPRRNSDWNGYEN